METFWMVGGDDKRGTDMSRATDSDFEKMAAGLLRELKADIESFKNAMVDRQEAFEKKIQANTELTTEVVTILKNARGFFATVDSLAGFAKKIAWIALTFAAGYLILKEWVSKKIGVSDGP